MNYDSILTKILIKQNRLNLSHYNRLIRLNKLTNIKEYLTYRYKDFTNYKEVIYRMHYGIENIPLCPICGKQTKFNIRSNKCYKNIMSIRYMEENHLKRQKMIILLQIKLKNHLEVV